MFVIRERLYAHPVHCEKLMTGKFRAFTMEEQTPLILFCSESSFKLSESFNLQAMAGQRHVGAPGRQINRRLGLDNKLEPRGRLIGRPFTQIYFKLFQPSTGLTKLPDSAYPNSGQFSEKHFRVSKHHCTSIYNPIIPRKC